MTTLDALIATWRQRQLAFFQQANAAPGGGPLHAHPAMLVSNTYARCANELAAWKQQHATNKPQGDTT